MDEITATEPVTSSMYVEYFRYGGSYFILAALVLIFLASQVAITGCDYWISYWLNIETVRRILLNGSEPEFKRYEKVLNDTFLSSIFTMDSSGLITSIDALYVYIFCLMFAIALMVGRSFFFMLVCVNASKNIYNIMFWSVLRTTMSFFNHNSTGK